MIGASPPRPKCEISTTAAAKMEATPRVDGVAAGASSSAPASTVNVRPAATTPCDARISLRIGVLADVAGCCASTTAPARMSAADAYEERLTKESQVNPIGNFAHRKRQTPRPADRTTAESRSAPSHAAARRAWRAARHDASGFPPPPPRPRSLRNSRSTPAARAWLTMAVQAGFVAGTLVTALTNTADVINPRRLFLVGGIAGRASSTPRSPSCRPPPPSSSSDSARARRSPGSIRRA